MFINARIASIALRDTSNVRDENQPRNRSQSVEMVLAGEGIQRLRLKTGEEFSRFSGEQDKIPPNLIAFRLQVVCFTTPTDSSFDAIRYSDGGRGDFSHDASISADYHLNAAAFADLIQNIRARIFPTHVTMGIDFAEDKLSFGSAMDGSEVIWDNTKKEKRAIALTSISFLSQPLTPTDTGLVTPDNFDFSTDIDLNPKHERDASLLKVLRITNWLLMVIAAALVLIILTRR